MYVYRKTDPDTWTVGYWGPPGDKWYQESDHRTPESAAARVHYLNGGQLQEAPSYRAVCPDCGQRGVSRGHPDCMYHIETREVTEK